MQWSLFLLVLMGQCSFFTCHLYEYRFIEKKKTWHDAQEYCRKNFADLATVSNMTDMKRLSMRGKNEDEAWIGLYNKTDGNKTWHWSLPGVEFNESEINWNEGEPNDIGNIENCGFIRSGLFLGDVACENKAHFLCYDENEEKPSKFHLINKEKNWLKAQCYCRKYHTDLVSGRHQLEDDELKEKIKSVESWITIGLFRDTWRWSDGSSFSFRSWHQGLKNEGHKKKCAVANFKEERNEDEYRKWSSDDCDKEKTFFCYDDKVILINENKTWEEALYYCRDNYRDLVSITNLDEQRWVQERVKNANSPLVWMGLRYTCTLDFWFWVSDEVVHYKNWASQGQMDHCDMSGAMDRGGQHQWFSKSDDKKFNFICSKL